VSAQKTNIVKHYVLTRFNLEPGDRINANLPFKGLDLSWLNHRFDLFEKYTVPSVFNQTNTNFCWLIFYHSNTPKAFQNRLLRIQENASCDVRIVSAQRNDVKTFLDQIKDGLKPNDMLVTSRIDNDDIIHPSFIQEVQDQASKATDMPQVVNFMTGYFYETQQKVLRLLMYYPNNPYQSMVELFHENLLTVMGYNHNQIPANVRVNNITTNEGMFITMVHEDNLLNRAYGKPIYKKVWMKNINLNLGKYILAYGKWFLQRVYSIIQHNLFRNEKSV
jgi:hypothetical protein